MHAAIGLDQGLAVLFGAATALSNAIAVATQHIASTRGGQRLRAWALAMHLVRQPLWLFGWVALTGSLIFQALALHFGPMSLVQPILVSELVMALLVRQFWIHQKIRAVTWLAALVTCGGLATFLIATSPSGVAVVPRSSAWTAPVAWSVGVAAVLVVAALRGSPSRRAGLLGAATGVLWALEATFIKAVTDTIAAVGIGGTLLRWPLYAFVLGGVLGLFAEQAALHVGPLKISQPFIVIVDPVVSVVLGVWLYAEHLRSGLVSSGLGWAGFAAMCAGVVVLTQSAPETMRGEVHALHQ
ncbi:MAG: DMT family transporter [Acidobacteria bacterium]|nr:DMT family transporter [Acidobacteriota bacterium]